MMPLLSYKQRMATLWKRPNGFYYATWEEGGKTRRKSLSTTDKRKATVRFGNFQRDLMAGKVKPIADGVREFFFEFCDEYLKHIETTCSFATYIQYDASLKKARASWGNIPLNNINSRHIDTFITDMARSGLKAPTINKNVRHIKAALTKAHRWEYIKNPVRFPKMIREERPLRYLTVEQLRCLIANIPDQEFSDLCLCSAYTGMRSGELLRLVWSDIDNPEGFIRISPKQKNKQESRIPINSHTKGILDRCKMRRTTDKVFRFECSTWISQKFKIAATAAKLPNHRFHDLRHTFASHLAMSGENLKAIQELMRHESIASTMIYAKVSPEYLRDVSSRLNYGPMPMASTARKQDKNRT